MPVDVEFELARLGAAWSESVEHVDVAEVLHAAPSLPNSDSTSTGIAHHQLVSKMSQRPGQMLSCGRHRDVEQRGHLGL